ncbi:MAG: glycosyltransferase N-terminal domain-containing protein, partial [Verrucomicrobiota bacterium]
LLPPVLLLSLPGFFRKMRRRGGSGPQIRDRLALYRPEIKARFPLEDEKKSLWIHAVSVGEIMVAARFLDAYLQRPDKQPHVVLSTTTSTGYTTALKQLPEEVVVIYNPFDLPGVLHRAFRLIRPDQIVLTESEIWPNLLRLASRRGIPVSIINARVSPRTERRYRRFGSFLSPVFDCLTQVLIQEEADRALWRDLGLKDEQIHWTGSIKFDPTGNPSVEPDAAAMEPLRRRLAEVWPDTSERRFLLLGSSHPGEESLIVSHFADWKERCPELRLLIAPRHVERCGEILEELGKYDVRVVRRSATGGAQDGPDVLLIDTTGELRNWYHLANWVVIGKSFLGQGGQNPVEPILAGKPVICGPHMENFSGLMERLLEKKGIVQVDSESLASAVAALFREAEEAAALANRGREAVEAHRGATVRTVGRIASPG